MSDVRPQPGRVLLWRYGCHLPGPYLGGGAETRLTSMGRHSPQLSPGQRIPRLALGATTVLILAAAVWVMGRGGAAEEAQLAATTTVTSSSAPETTLPTTTEAPVTTVPTTLPPTTVPTTTLPTTTIEASTTTTLAPLLLMSDGLGAVDFGDDAESVIAAVAERLEGSSSDSGWVAARGQFGTCPGTVVRVVRWDSLRLFFSDGPTEFAEGLHHFFYYSQSIVETDRVLDLTTREGITLGTTVEELEDVFGDQLTIESTISFGVNFVVDRPGRGLLSGNLTSSSPDGTVTAIAGGFGCGG